MEVEVEEEQEEVAAVAIDQGTGARGGRTARALGNDSLPETIQNVFLAVFLQKKSKLYFCFVK